MTRSCRNVGQLVADQIRPLSRLSMRRSWLLATGACLGVTIAVAGCLSDRRDDESSQSRGRNGHDRAELNLFISPAGKPYHADQNAPYPVVAWFADTDTDRDGRISRAEFIADADRFFRELDADHDGIVDGFEVQAYEQKIAPEILPSPEGLHADEGMDTRLLDNRGGRRGAPQTAARSNKRILAGDRRPQGAALYGVLDEPEPVTAADADFSGRITPEEWRAKADARFDLLDLGQRGYLTIDRLPTTAAQDLLARLRKRDAARRDRAGPH